jgi:hypothetical protein
MSLMSRLRQPLYWHGIISAVALGILLLNALLGIWSEPRGSRAERGAYWGFLFLKGVGIQAVLILAVWEFSQTSSVTVTGGATFLAELLTTWLFIIVCSASIRWSLTDQHARCRSCLQFLQCPVHMGCVGAILLDHSGTELVCREGHGVLFVPEASSDYVQSGGWARLV